MHWPEAIKKFLSRVGIQQPVIQAPMAGGYTTPALVAAVSNAGGLGSIAAALLQPEEILAIIQEIRKLTTKPFAVNLFAPLKYQYEEHKIQKMYQLLAGYRDELGIPSLPTPQLNPPPAFDKQLDAILSEQIKIISFTFGTPDPDIIRKLRDHHITISQQAHKIIF
jgi:nitronate monooxygenase